MSTFWRWVETSKQTGYRVLAEAIEQQQQRFAAALQQKFPALTPQQVGNLLNFMAEQEKTLADPDDQRKSATTSKFLKTFKPDPAQSPAHQVDRFKRELQAAVQRANAKGKTPEQVAAETRAYIRGKLPEEEEDVIDRLLGQVMKGARPDDVIRAYLASQRPAEGDEILSKSGPYKLIQITTFTPGGTDKHIDTKQPAPCHRLFRGTKWCVRFENYFNDYAASGPLYLVTTHDQPTVLGHPNSAWLDTEDTPPDPAAMAPIARFLMQALPRNSHGEACLLYAAPYLPQPAEEIAAMMQSGGVSAKKAAQLLVGRSDAKVVGNRIVVHTWNDLEACLNGLEKIGNNTVKFDINGYDEWASEAIASQNYELADLVGNLDARTEEAVVDWIGSRMGGEEDDAWQDMTPEELVEADTEAYGVLQMALEDAMSEMTWSRVKKSVLADIQQGDGTWSVGWQRDAAGHEHGFTLSTGFVDVNMYWGEQVKHARRAGNLDIESGMYEKMEIVVEEPTMEIDFDSRVYNRKVLEAIGPTKEGE